MLEILPRKMSTSICSILSVFKHSWPWFRLMFRRNSGAADCIKMLHFGVRDISSALSRLFRPSITCHCIPLRSCDHYNLYHPQTVVKSSIHVTVIFVLCKRVYFKRALEWLSYSSCCKWNSLLSSVFQPILLFSIQKDWCFWSWWNIWVAATFACTKLEVGVSQFLFLNCRLHML